MNTKKLFFILTTAVLLITAACEGAFIDPGMLDQPGGGSGGGGSGGGGGGGGGGDEYFTSPSTPSGLTATVQSQNSIRISWNAVSGATGYNVYRSTSATVNYTNIITTASTSYTDTGLTTGTAYYYKVSAYNSYGTSSQSGYVSATPSSVPTYTINFDSNGGTGTIAPMTALSGTSITLPNGSGFSKIGYTFGGWSTNISGTGNTYGSGASYSVTGSTTLYAIWNSNLSGGGTKANPFQLTENTWSDGSINSTTANKEVWYSFDFTAGTKYYVFWNDNKTNGGDGTKTLDVKVTAYYDDDTEAFLESDAAWITAKDFTPDSDGTVKIKVTSFISSGTGTFAILYNTTNKKPCTVIFDINGGSGTAPAAKTVDSGTSITLPDGTGLTRPGYNFVGWNTKTTGTGNYYKAGASYDVTGNVTLTTLYVKWGSTALGGEFNPISLYEDTWDNGNITTATPNREIWYSINVIASNNYYLWWNEKGTTNGDGTKTLDVKVTAYYDDDTTVFLETDSAWNTAKEFTPASDGTVKIKVVPVTDSETGTFAIVYNTTGTRPGVPRTVTFNINGGSGTAPAAQTVNSGTSITLPAGTGLTRPGYTFIGWNTNAAGTGRYYMAGDSYTVPNNNVTLYARWGSTALGGEDNPIELSENTWADGEITAGTLGKEVWYSFNITNGNTYRVWWNDSYNTTSGDGNKTLDVRVTAYYDNGTTIFTDIDTAWNTAQNFTASSTSTTVKLKVVPKNSASVGTFAIVYSTTGTKPSIPYNVTFNSNGGSGTVPDAQTVNSGTSITLPDGTSLTRFGYNFIGWNTNAAGTGRYYMAGAFTVSNNVTFYARWGSTALGGESNPNLPAAGVWDVGEITDDTPGKEVWYSFTVTSGTTYRIWWEELGSTGSSNKTLDVKVTAYYDDGIIIFQDIDIAWGTAQNFTASGTSTTVKLKVVPKNSASVGTFAVVYSTGTTRP